MKTHDKNQRMKWIIAASLIALAFGQICQAASALEIALPPSVARNYRGGCWRILSPAGGGWARWAKGALAPSSKVEDEDSVRAPTATETLTTVGKLINNGLTPGESFRYEVMDSDVSVEVYGIFIPQEKGMPFEGLSDQERQKIDRKFPPVTKDGQRPFLLVRERSKDGAPLFYLVLYPTPSGMAFIKSRRSTHFPSNLSMELEKTCLGLNPVRKERRFDERIFNQIISYSAGYRFRKNYFVNKNVLGAFIETLAQLRVEAGGKVTPLNESNLERALTGFGYPVNYISSHYKLYTHYQQLGLDIKKRFQALLNKPMGELDAFIRLMKRLETKDKFRLLNEGNLQGVLTGFGYPVRYISGCYKLYTHYQQLGLNIRRRFRALLNKSTGELDAFIKLMKELEVKDKFRLLNEGNLEGVLTGFGYHVEYIGSSYALYTHYKRLGLDIAERYLELLNSSTGELDAFISLMKELEAKDKFRLLNEGFLQEVLVGFGHPVMHINSYYKLYTHYQRLGLDIVERYRALLNESTGELDAFISLMKELEAKDKFKLLNEGNLEGGLRGFGYPVNYISSHYKLYTHYQRLGLDIEERYPKLLDTSAGALDAFIKLKKELEAKDKFKLLNEGNLEGVLIGFGYPVWFINSAYRLYTHYQRLGLDIVERYQDLLNSSKEELDAFVSLMKELEAKDRFRLLNEKHLEGVLIGFGYPVEGISRAYEKLKRAEPVRTIEESVAYLLSQKQEMVGLDLHTVGLFKDYLIPPATAESLYKLLHSIRTNEEFAKAIIALDVERDGSLRKALLVELIRRNEKFIRAKANSLIRRFSLSDSLLEDLVQEGGMAFINYIERYDPARGKVLTYLSYWIEQGMRQYLVPEITPLELPQYVVEEIGILSRVRRELEASMDMEPPLEELVKALKERYPKERHPNIEWTQEEVLRLQALATRETITLDRPLEGDEGEDYYKIVEDRESPSPLDEAIAAEDRSRVKASVDSLPNLRHRLLLDLRYGFTMDAMSLEKVGHILGITRERVRQEEKKALRHLKTLMQGGVIRRREIGEEEKMMRYSNLSPTRRRNRRNFLLERFVKKNGDLRSYFGLIDIPESLIQYKVALIENLSGELGIDPVRDWVILLRDRYRLVDELNALRDSPNALAQFKADLRAEQQAKEKEIENRFRGGIVRLKNELERKAQAALSQSL